MNTISAQKKKCIFSILTFLLSLLVLEAGAYLLFTLLAHQSERDRIAEIKNNSEDNDYLLQNCVPHPYTLFMPKPNFRAHGKKQHNSSGFRGREISIEPEKFRIVCMGGSTTYSWKEKDPDWSYPSQLEKQLVSSGKDVEVINAGLPIGSSAEIVATLHFRVLPLKPDLVILHVSFNDIFPTLMPDYKPDYTHDRKPWTVRTKSLMSQCRVLLNSHLMKFMYLVYIRTAEETVQPDYINQLHWNWEEYFTTGDADDPRRYIGFSNNVRSLLAICEKNKVAVVLSPTNVRQHEYKNGMYPAFYKAHEKNTGILQKLAAEFPSAVFFDTRKISLSENPHDGFVDLCHLSRKGLTVKAKAFAEFILAKKLIRSGT